MKIQIQKASLKSTKDHTLIIPLYQQGGKAKLPKNGAFLKSILAKLSKDKLFKADFKQASFIRYAGAGRSQNLMLIGLGKKDDISRNRLREALLVASQLLSKAKVPSFSFHLGSADLSKKYDASVLALLSAESLALPLYQFLKFKKDLQVDSGVKSIGIVVDSTDELKRAKEGVSKAKKNIDACNFVRDLVTTPHNELTSVMFSDIAKKEAKAAGLKVTVWGEKELQKNKFGAFLSVNKGSAVAPRFVILEHKPSQKNVKTICLVGKGITFDTGGISLKPAAGMWDMRYDMTGAATVLGVMLLAARLNLNVHVAGFLCLTNNMPSSKATVPGDIVTAHNGKTIEVLNTDAEGRLVLADGLAYADKTYNPDLLIDFATLTGACVVALGNQGSAIMGTDQKAMDQFRKLNCDTGEKTWQLPIWDELASEMTSDYADLKNIGSTRGAGTAKAAAFLQNFVREKTPWVHFDIAGSAFISKPTNRYAPKGATAACVRLVSEFLAQV